MPGRVDKKYRAVIACDNCRKRKIRCDSGRPSCKNCNKLNEQCVYTPSERQSIAGFRFTSLEKRFERVEKQVEALVEKVDTVVQGTTKDQDANQSSGETSTQVTTHTPKVTPPGAALGVVEDDLNEATSIFPTFNDRLSRLKAHMGNNDDTGAAYTSGVFLSIFSPSDITRLSYKLNEPFLARRLETASNEVWRINQSTIARLLEVSADAQFHPMYLESCTELYMSIDSNFLKTFLSNHEAGHEFWSQLPDDLQSAISAALVMLGYAILTIRRDFEPYTVEFVENQKKIAINHAIKALNLIRFTRPSFFLLRISFLLFWVLCIFSTVPSILHMFPPLITHAMAVGVHKPHLNARYPTEEAERRNNVWFILESYQHLIAIVLSKDAWYQSENDSIPASLPPCPQSDGKPSDIDPLVHGIALCKIYDRARRHLFSVQNSKVSRSDLQHRISEFDREIKNWRAQLPEGFVENLTQSIAEIHQFSEWMFVLTSGNVLQMYYHLLIAVHSIPAFYPVFLPESMPESLDIVSDAARSLLTIASGSFRRKSMITLLLGSCVTAAVGTLLYKQLCYSLHETNESDLQLLKNHIPQLKNTKWPTGTRCYSSEVSMILIDIMNRLYATKDTIPEIDSSISSSVSSTSAKRNSGTPSTTRGTKTRKERKQPIVQSPSVSPYENMRPVQSLNPVNDDWPSAAAQVRNGVTDLYIGKVNPTPQSLGAIMGTNPSVPSAMSPILDDLDKYLPDDLMQKEDSCMIS